VIALVCSAVALSMTSLQHNVQGLRFKKVIFVPHGKKKSSAGQKFHVVHVISYNIETRHCKKQ
jgi:hypothetical protein